MEAVIAPVAASAPPHSSDGIIASALMRIEAMGASLVAAVERNAVANRRAELERLIIRPTLSNASSPSSTSTSGGARSPRAHERLQLKRDVISFYGLWDPATEHLAEVSSRRVFTMLSPSSPRASVTFKDATLAHIWPSALARESDLLRQQLGLPPAFHVHVRNFLILDRAVELAFDADALLLLPARAKSPAPPTVRARAFRIEHQAAAADGGVAARALIASLAGHELHLPRAGEGRVPFMRLLAWKALSALRAGSEAYEGEAAFPVDVDVDATVSRDHAGHRPGSSGFSALLSAGLIFGLGARA